MSDKAAPKNPAATPTVDANKETIVVAEDSAPNRKILQHLLEKLGYNVIACEDGQIAWDKIKNKDCPNLVMVISDMMMPNLDGLGFLKNVRGTPEIENLPFVLITAVSDKEYIVEAKKNKVNGYILKPVTFQKVQNKLEDLFPTKVFPKLTA